jgi:hypothetical protein
MLWIMDASINISMEPFRAFVGDMLPNDQRTMGFAMQSFFIGLGAVVASALPYMLTNWLNIPNVAEIEGQVPPSVKWAFYIGAAVFFISVMVTILTTKEYSPEQLKEYERAEKAGRGVDQSDDDHYDQPVANSKFSKTGVIFSIIGLAVLLLTYFFELEKELYIIGGIMVLFAILMFFSIWLKNRGRSVFRFAAHATYHASTGGSPVFYLDGAFCHVDLYHSRCNQPYPGHKRYKLGFIQRRGRLGGRIVWSLQWCCCPCCFLIAGTGKIYKPKTNPCFLFNAGCSRISFNLPFQRYRFAVDTYDWYWHCLGFNFVVAVCHSYRLVAFA